MSQRDFDFPVSTLIRDSKRLLGALRDEKVGPPVARRLRQKDPDPAKPPIEFGAGFEAQIKLVEKGGTDQSTAVGTIGELTEEQALAFTEMERLTASARRSAGLAFHGNDPRLHAEFQVGIHEPQDLGSELERAGKILAACTAHAAALAEHGWIDEDTAALAAAIATLTGDDDEQEKAKDQKKGITAARTRAANALYKMCRSLQNAARLAFPNTKAADALVVEARARYLLDEFPPRGGASAGDQPPGPTPGSTPK